MVSPLQKGVRDITPNFLSLRRSKWFGGQKLAVDAVLLLKVILNSAYKSISREQMGTKVNTIQTYWLGEGSAVQCDADQDIPNCSGR